MKKGLIFVLSIVVLAILFAVGSVYMKGQKSEKIESVVRKNAWVLEREYSQTLGSEEAKVTIVEFLDPGCETCRAFAPFIKGALEAFPGKVRLVIRYAPLHEGADYMVTVLEAAGKQGKYWDTLQVMYDSQPAWASHQNPQPQLIWQYLPQVGLDLEQLKKDMEDPEIARRIQQDIADARALNVTKTPEFFVNGRPLATFGAEPLKALIISELQLNYSNEVNTGQGQR